MRRITIACIVILMLFPCTGAFAKSKEWKEIGIHIGVGILPPAIPTAQEQLLGAKTQLSGEIHLGYAFLKILYLSYDLFLISPYSVREMTTKTVDGLIVDGFYRPGLLNQLDFGIRPVIGNLAILAQLGINYLYIFEQKELYDDENLEDLETNFGINLRVGLGLHYKWGGFMVTGTVIFPSAVRMGATIKDLFAEDPFVQEAARNNLRSSLFPALIAYFHF